MQERMFHGNMLPTTRGVCFGGMQSFFESHGEFSLGRVIGALRIRD
jgi:hypothetical protein